MAEQKAFLDYRTGGDTGQSDAASIQPFNNGEAANQLVLGRPSENLRLRTETIRDNLQDLFYHRDFSKLIYELTPGGSIAWGGPLNAGGTGIVTVTGTIKVSPILSPTAPIRGALAVGTQGSNLITYAASSQSFASQGLNAVTIEHRASPGKTLAVSISGTPVSRVLVEFDAGNSGHTPSAVKTAFDAAVVGNSALAGKLSATISGAGVVSALVETPLSGSVDDESHWVAGTLITAATTARKLNLGDGLAIWYKYVVEATADASDPKGSVAGGRGESSITRGNSSVPAGSIFVTSDSARKIPGAIPLFRVGYGGQLIFADGSRIAAGETTSFQSPATIVTGLLNSYNTGTVVPQTTAAIDAVQTQLTAAYQAAISNSASNTSQAITSNYTTAITNAISNSRSTITAEYNTAINNAVSGINPGITLAQLENEIDSALAALPASNKYATAAIKFATGGDHNGINGLNVLFDGTYPGGGDFFVGTGAYNLTVDAASTSAPRRVSAELLAGGYTSLTNTTTFTVHDIEGEWNGFEFKSNAGGGFRAKNKLVLRNCAIDANAFTIADGATLLFENVVITGTRNTVLTADGLTIPPNCNLIFNNVTIKTVTSGAVVRGGLLRIKGPSTDYALRQFNNCTFTGGTAASGQPTHALLVTDENNVGSFHMTQFNNCHFHATCSASTAMSTARVYNSLGVVFNNCKFFGFGGQILDHDTSNAKYNDCIFEGSQNAGQVSVTSRLIQVTTATDTTVLPYALDNGTYFSRCFVRICEETRKATNLQPVIEMGREPLTGTPETSRVQCPIFVDGLYVTYAGTNLPAIAKEHLLLRGGFADPVDVHNVYKNIVLDMRGCYTSTVANFSLISIKGRNAQPITPVADDNVTNVEVENLQLCNVTSPSIANSTVAFLTFDAVNARNVTILGIPSVQTLAASLGSFCSFGTSSIVENLVIKGAKYLYTTQYLIVLISSADTTFAGTRLRGGKVIGLPNYAIRALLGIGPDCDVGDYDIQCAEAFTQVYPILRLSDGAGVNGCKVRMPATPQGTTHPMVTVATTGANIKFTHNSIIGSSTAQVSIALGTANLGQIYQGNHFKNLSSGGTSITPVEATTTNNA